jgi:predicted secreted protein
MKQIIRNLIAASQDQDKFWREWHMRRAEKRLAYWEAERRKHLRRAFNAGRMAQHYMDRICGVKDSA